MKDLYRVRSLLSVTEQRKFGWLALVLLCMGILEVVGVVSILPFIQLVADPGIVDRSDFLHQVYVAFNFSSAKEMLLWAGGAVIVLLCLTNGFSVFKTWLQYRISWSVAHNVSMRLLASYLGRPYEYFINRNTTEFTTYVIGETTSLVNGVILPVLEIFSRGIVCLIIFVLLLWIDVQVALVMFGALGLAYLIIFLTQRRYLRRIGEERLALAVRRYQNLIQMFNGIKTVQVFDRDDFFTNRYEQASREFCDMQPRYHTTVAAPRYILEVLAFSAIVGVTIYLYLTVGNIAGIVPKLSLYAVAGYRLLPALQAAFAAVGKFVHTYPVVDKLHAAFYAGRQLSQAPEDQPRSMKDYVQKQETDQPRLHGTISLQDVSFTYENNDKPTLHHLNLSIAPGETVAFVGATGSGKTTIVDLIVGLLSATEGEVKIGNKVLVPEELQAWRQNIAYVPQDVFLFDDTVARNITLRETLPPAAQQRLQEAARMADIDAFISGELPRGYDTLIGERGVRLSGGQRQRLGLARAFFHQPAVLVLDEATSALDNVTERGIIKALELLPGEITTIVIAHRLSTVRKADRIFLVENGRITVQGTYNDLVSNSKAFQEMANTN